MLRIFIFVLLIGSFASAHFTPVQENALQQVLNWIHSPEFGCGRTPHPKEFRKPRLPISYHKLVGSGIYQKHPKAIFRSSEEFWLSLFAFAQEQGRPISLLHGVFQNPSPQLLGHLKEEAMQTVLNWIRKHRRLPHYSDFGRGPEKIPIVFQRLTSSGSYACGHGKRGLYPSISAFWEQLALRATAEEDLAKFVSAVRFRHLDDDISPDEANARVLAWVKAHPGEVPLARDFGAGPDQIPLHYARLVGQGCFAPGKANAAKAHFLGVQEFWCQFKHYAAEQGVQFRLLNVLFRGGLLETTRALLQAEALELVVDWINTQRRLPMRLDYGFKPGQIPVDYRRLTGLDAYAPEMLYHRAAIFSSPAEFHQHLLDFAAESQHSSCSNFF